MDVNELIKILSEMPATAKVVIQRIDGLWVMPVKAVVKDGENGHVVLHSEATVPSATDNPEKFGIYDTRIKPKL